METNHHIRQSPPVLPERELTLIDGSFHDLRNDYISWRTNPERQGPYVLTTPTIDTMTDFFRKAFANELPILINFAEYSLHKAQKEWNMWESISFFLQEWKETMKRKPHPDEKRIDVIGKIADHKDDRYIIPMTNLLTILKIADTINKLPQTPDDLQTKDGYNANRCPAKDDEKPHGVHQRRK